MLPLNEILVLLIAGLAFYFFKRPGTKSTASSNVDDEIPPVLNDLDCVDEAMKDMISPDRHGNSVNINNHYRNYDE